MIFLIGLNSKSMKKYLCLFFLIGAGLFVVQSQAFANSTYGSGNYGDCQYSSCSITITNNSSVALSLTPTSGGSCAIGSDSVIVTTHNSNGYFLTLSSATSQTSLNNGTSQIPTSSGTFASPSLLAVNKWGYRIDGQGGFGSGPTTLSTNPSLSTFAGVAVSPGDTVKTTTVATSNSGDTTPIWYGVCADSSNKNGSYSVSITYTATANP
jgi:hypothetical protein